MARKQKDPSKIKLAQPDRSGPTDKTLLEWAEERNLFAEAARKREQGSGGGGGARRGDKPGGEEDGDDEDDDDELVMTPRQERVLESILWTATIASVHFTLDVLVQTQYAMEIKWDKIVVRTGQAFLVFLLLFYPLHPHPSSPRFLPLLPTRHQEPLRQALFLAASVAAGCYLVHLTNTYSYIAVMKRAPTVGCVWLWSVVELDLVPSVAGVAAVLGFVYWGGYKIM